MIVLDASVLIAHFDAADAHHDAADQQLLEIAEQPLGCSPLTLAEVLAGPARSGRLETVHRAIEELEVVEIPLPPGAATRLARLRAETGLRLPDCCVLLAAQIGEAQFLLTFDDRLRREAQRLGF